MNGTAPLPGWPHAESPWHAGERAAQARAGVLDDMAALGRRVLRAAMPQQHRDFFAQLPFVVLGAVDAAGQPWATLLPGAPGFVRSPDDRTLALQALPPPDDPLARLLRRGAPLGLLGIELETRRRNRANGVLQGVHAGGFVLDVRQSFGNCPRYIQRRERVEVPVAQRSGAHAEPRPCDRLDAADAVALGAADTAFVATFAPGDEASAGADVSHRGGPPGFLRVSDEGRCVTWPDYAGNGFFNTLGNLALEPRAGLLVPDFAAGALLHVAGRAEVVWEGAELATVPGAQRLVRLHVRAVLRRPAALPWRWRLVERSPFLP